MKANDIREMNTAHDDSDDLLVRIPWQQITDIYRQSVEFQERFDEIFQIKDRKHEKTAF